MSEPGWPPRIGKHDLRVGSFGRCAACPKDAPPSRAGTFVRYGGRPLCMRCARAQAASA